MHNPGCRTTSKRSRCSSKRHKLGEIPPWSHWQTKVCRCCKRTSSKQVFLSVSRTLDPLCHPPPSGGGSGGATLSTQDEAFVNQAATSSLAEIAEGQIAIQRGNPATSEFGRWMTADHGAMNTALGAIAQSEGFSLPTTVTPAQQSDLDALQNNSDGTFDSVYATNQVVDHVKVLMTFVREATTGTDPALVAFAKSGLPVLEQHLYGAAELKLGSLGIAPPTGSLSSLLQNGIAAAGTHGSLLTDAIFP